MVTGTRWWRTSEISSPRSTQQSLSSSATRSGKAKNGSCRVEPVRSRRLAIFSLNVIAPFRIRIRADEGVATPRCGDRTESERVSDSLRGTRGRRHHQWGHCLKSEFPAGYRTDRCWTRIFFSQLSAWWKSASASPTRAMARATTGFCLATLNSFTAARSAP